MSKKSRFAILTFVLLFAIGMCCVACNNSSTKKSYKVSFDTDGGTEVAEIVCNEGDKLSLPTDPAKAHYTFDGWYTNAERTADSKFDAEKAISSDMTLYAKWQAVKYTVTFKADGEQVGEALTYTVENKQITEPAVPEKIGYSGAWGKYELDCKNIEVNAVYTVIPYSVTFKADGEQVGEVLTYTVENKQITEPSVPEKDGFIGEWEEYELNCENIVVNAVYTAVYTVTFKAEGVQVGEILTYTLKNKQITEPAVPEKAGYNGAWEEYELNGGNKVVNAEYTAKTDIAYTVEHYQQNIADDDYSLVAADTQNLTGTTDTDTNATAKNYTGFTALQIKQAKIAGDGSTVIKVYYDRLTYTVIWKGVSGEVVETDENVRYGAMPSYDGGKLYADDSPTRVKSQKWNPTPVEVSADAEYTVEIVSELAFFAKDSTKMTIEEITEGDFAGSV
ncbi:MAG: InlB B-repeat-containing protein, partial [Candidatus Borkfalkiaceae bacterium]|nr:InlB B-repeat-containing protein [Christensenellaceae bacterium]